MLPEVHRCPPRQPKDSGSDRDLGAAPTPRSCASHSEADERVEGREPTEAELARTAAASPRLASPDPGRPPDRQRPVHRRPSRSGPTSHDSRNARRRGGRFGPFWDVYSLIQNDYAGSPSERGSLAQAAIKGMMESLNDPWSYYPGPSDFENSLLSVGVS